MQKQQPSTIFKFVLNTEETLKNLDELKINNYQKFKQTTTTGKMIQELSKANDKEQLQELCDKHIFEIPFLKLQIEDAFISSFNLRNYQVTKYYLENGFEIQKYIDDAVISLTYSLSYLMEPSQQPLELLQLILLHGADPRHSQRHESNTAMHIAAQNGSLDFIKLLVKYGADINAVNDDKKTPLNLAIKSKKSTVVEYLKSLGASEHWNK